MSQNKPAVPKFLFCFVPALRILTNKLFPLELLTRQVNSFPPSSSSLPPPLLCSTPFPFALFLLSCWLLCLCSSTNSLRFSWSFAPCLLTSCSHIFVPLEISDSYACFSLPSNKSTNQHKLWPSHSLSSPGHSPLPSSL